MSTPDPASRPAGTPGTTLVRFWAGARAAAGVDEETLAGVATVGALVAQLGQRHPALAGVLPVCSILVDGRAGDPGTPVPDGAVIEVLPPFAGG